MQDDFKIIIIKIKTAIAFQVLAGLIYLDVTYCEGNHYPSYPIENLGDRD